MCCQTKLVQREEKNRQLYTTTNAGLHLAMKPPQVLPLAVIFLFLSVFIKHGAPPPNRDFSQCRRNKCFVKNCVKWISSWIHFVKPVNSQSILFTTGSVYSARIQRSRCLSVFAWVIIYSLWCKNLTGKTIFISQERTERVGIESDPPLISPIV